MLTAVQQADVLALVYGERVLSFRWCTTSNRPLKDRTNIGNAKLAGMGDDLELSSNEYSVALVVFFASYVFFEAPSNMVCFKAHYTLSFPRD